MNPIITTFGELVLSARKGHPPESIETRVANGTLRLVSPGVYTTNLVDTLESIVRRNVWPIIAHVVPGAILSYRSMLDGGLVPKNGQIHLGYKHTRTIKAIPGLTIHLHQAPAPVDGDQPFMDTLYQASEARAWLEAVGRSTATSTKGLTHDPAIKRLERILSTRGSGVPRGLNGLRDAAHTLAPLLGREVEFEKLDQWIGETLMTRSAPAPAQRATQRLRDDTRMQMFDQLKTDLLGATEYIGLRRTTPTSEDYRQYEAFFEAYFSNFIEGTEFLVEEAEDIIFNGRIIPTRMDDSHDILGTFRVVVDPTEMTRVPATDDEFLELLCRRHQTVLSHSPEKTPGQFKTWDNRVGTYPFVRPELVEGTLSAGFQIAQSLGEPFQRAFYLMFLVTEVHPFLDGNGRLARIMMNAELEAGGHHRIIVPTVSRDDYMLPLRRLSREGDPHPLIRSMARLQRFGSLIPFGDYVTALAALKEANAFDMPGEKVLRMPISEPTGPRGHE